ncbi:unnamed protein product [Camellia sinensis]
MDRKNNLLSSFLGLMLKMSGSSGGQPAATASAVPTLPKPNPMSYHGEHQKKRAVLCGVSYQKKKHKLKGTINDVKRMKSLLVDHFQFPENAICVLTEEENDPELSPTKKNIQNALQWLVQDNMGGDSLVFYFSGHGLRQPDFAGDESDEFDETICPSDFATAGMILDNYINSTIVKPLKHGVKLHAIIDACHSGTILDLPHVYKPKSKQWGGNKSSSGGCESTNDALAICLSACADNQLATDTNAFTGKEMSGAMTYNFVNAIEAKKRITYGELLDEMHNNITKHVNTTGCLNLNVLWNVFRNKPIQEPQMSSSKIFNVDEVELNL